MPIVQVGQALVDGFHRGLIVAAVSAIGLP
jgi:hypothetical protein